MARVLPPAMNSVNRDLEFTTELAKDFWDRKLPALDFKMWFENSWEINELLIKLFRQSSTVAGTSGCFSVSKLNRIYSS